MRRSLAFALLCAALPAGTAAAQQPTYAPPPASAAPSPRRAHFVLAMGGESGSDQLAPMWQITVDGKEQKLKAGSGFWFAGGLSFLETASGPVTWDGLATIAVKGWNVGGDNGDVRSLGFPLELLARVKYQQVRLGAGIDYLMSPSAKTTGDFAGLYDEKFDNALGFALHLDWAVRQPNAKAGFFVGAKIVLQTLDSKTYPGTSYSANSFGVQLGFEI